MHKQKICPNCRQGYALEELIFCGLCYQRLFVNKPVDRFCMAITESGEVCHTPTTDAYFCACHQGSGYGVFMYQLNQGKP